MFRIIITAVSISLVMAGSGDADVIFDDNASICQECQLGEKRVYAITTARESHAWVKDYADAECPPKVFRTFARAVDHFLSLPLEETQWQ